MASRQETRVFNKSLSLMLIWGLLMLAALAVTAYVDLRMAKFVPMFFLPMMPFILFYQIFQIRQIRAARAIGAGGTKG